MWSRRTAQPAIVIAGCLGMAYTQLTMSPATVDFARSLGATGFHVGLLGALPTGMLFTQFFAAIVVGRLRHRRWLWFWVSVLQRLVYVPVAIGAWLLPQTPDAAWMWALVLVTAANHAMLHFCTPLWLSWMGDYLPRRGLSRFWGVRQLWMQWTAALSMFVGAVFLLKTGVEIRTAFAVLITLGAVLGVADILLFLRVAEPQVRPQPELNLWAVLAAPFRDRQFRTFIDYSCFWHVAAMIGAPFISLFLLEHVGMDLYSVLLLWTCSWVGGAVFSGRLGHWVERVGHRPVLVLCTVFKSINMIALLAVPVQPMLAFWVLVPVFMADAVLNAGIALASNGYMLKNSPRAQRTTFIAAGTALAGMVGGVTAVLAGWALVLLEPYRFEWAGMTFVNFHWIFAGSVVLRLWAIVLALRIREPSARGTTHVVVELIGATPLRALMLPLGLYRPEPERGVAVPNVPAVPTVPAVTAAPIAATAAPPVSGRPHSDLPLAEAPAAKAAAVAQPGVAVSIIRRVDTAALASGLPGEETTSAKAGGIPSRIV